MRKFWDRRAEENALYYVDNRLEYADPDTERFWEAGREDFDDFLEVAGVSIAPDDRVLEIGCGVGRLTRQISARAQAVLALDVSERMLEMARGYNPQLENVTWLLGDGESLQPIEDASVDLCVSHVVFQHIPDPGITLSYVREMGRVLRPGGRSAFQVSNLPAIHAVSGAGRFASALKGWLRSGPRGQDHPAWRGSAIDLDELAVTAEEAGLRLQGVAGRGTQFCIVTLRRV